MHTRLLTLVVLAAALATPASAATSHPQQRLDAARKQWKAAHVSSYRYEVAVSCFCAPRNGHLFYVVRHGVARPPRNGDKSVATVPRLLRMIQDAIDRHVARLDVTYGRRGVPKSIYIDGVANIADDEVTYTITHFTTLK
ncbi:MAG TPA: DUF6174 domain-containing protein [Solirubrobacteraceae bacterium]|jgi:hypothetical protein|nr:DUF6174 domain-containing protein [Solirubrobacteraceae bacterium]